WLVVCGNMMVEMRRQPHRGIDEERVDERLRQVAAQLMAAQVDLLGEETGTRLRASGSFEEVDGSGQVAVVRGGECCDESADGEGSFGIAEPSAAVTEPEDVPVSVEDALHRPQRRDRGGVGARKQPAD